MRGGNNEIANKDKLVEGKWLEAIEKNETEKGE